MGDNNGRREMQVPRKIKAMNIYPINYWGRD